CGGCLSASLAPPESGGQGEIRFLPGAGLEPGLCHPVLGLSAGPCRLRRVVACAGTRLRLLQPGVLVSEHTELMGPGLFMRASRIKMIPSAAVPTSSPSEETTSDARGKNVEVCRDDSPGGMPEPLELIRIAGSETRNTVQLQLWLQRNRTRASSNYEHAPFADFSFTIQK